MIAGFYLSFLISVIPVNWKCFNDIISKSAEDMISLKDALEISTSYLLKGKNKKDVIKNKNRSRFMFSLICLSIKLDY